MKYSTCKVCGLLLPVQWTWQWCVLKSMTLLFLSIYKLLINVFVIHWCFSCRLIGRNLKPLLWFVLYCIVSGSGFTILVSFMFVLIENRLENRVGGKRERNGKRVASSNSPQLFQLHLKRLLLSHGWPYCVRGNQKAFCAPFAKQWDGFIRQPCKQDPHCFCSRLLHRS